MFLNTSFYRFHSIDDPESLRASASDEAKRRGLKGTLLIASEGVNANLVGEPGSVREFESFLAALLGVSLEVKHSYSERIPFRRLLVRVKPQILTFRTGNADPLRRPGQRVSPDELRRWLDEKPSEIALVDCRNRFEAAYGSFRGAEVLEMESFDDFPTAYEKLKSRIGDKKVVMFCTGGIRCEKASSYLQDKGEGSRVFQLHGGVLKYFEECGGAHWDGSCFVFDDRIAVRPDGSPDPEARLETEAAVSSKYRRGEK